MNVFVYLEYACIFKYDQHLRGNTGKHGTMREKRGQNQQVTKQADDIVKDYERQIGSAAFIYRKK